MTRLLPISVFFVAVLLAALVAAGPLAWAKPAVTDVRLGAHADKTRFVLDLDEEPAYRAFTLPDPFRVVIDLPALDWALGPDKMSRGGGLVDSLRFGLFAPGTSRVVLDVNRPVAIKQIFVLPGRGSGEGGHRLVVDLVPVSRDAYFAGSREPILSRAPMPRTQTAIPQAPARPAADKRPAIVLDPGHGGVDPGATGRSGIYEKALVLDYAKEIARQLEASGRYRVHMTREDDVFIRLRDRVARAQELEADLFVSLHANTNPSRKLRGASVYTLSENASDAEAAALAAKENKADMIAGIDLSDQTEVVSKILIDLAQRETMNQSKTYANMLVGEMATAGRVLRNTHRSAGFAVLKSPVVPSVLVELGYMSNKEEERLLRSEAYRRKLSAALVRAIDDYFTWQQNARR
jgi:N-acetylmuramoyl-L-alanine amidase